MKGSIYYTISNWFFGYNNFVIKVPRILSWILCILNCAGTGLFAQSRTTAALAGTVVDDSGRALTGALVQIQSAALIQDTKRIVTDAQGRFRFSELPSGQYQATVSFSGYKPVQLQGLQLSAGKTAEVRVAMTLYASAETVVVRGESSPIDSTSSSMPAILSRDFLRNIPTDRDTSHILNLAPGINLESAYGGAAESGVAYQTDGVDISDPQGGAPWSFFNYSLIDQVHLIGLGAPAEYGQFTGVVYNTITKSGADEPTGSAELFFSNKSLTASNSEFADISSTIEKHAETTLQLGGPIRKDALWYFISGQYLQDDSSEGGPIETEKDPRIFGKLTWKASQKSTLSGWLEWDHTTSIGRDGDAFTPLEATTGEDNPELVGNISWNSTMSDKAILSIAWGGYKGHRNHNPHNGFSIPGHVDAQTGLASENASQFGIVDRSRNQINASIDYHAAGWITGYHDFKFGSELESSSVRDRFGYPGDAFFSDNEGPTEDPGTGKEDLFTLAYYGGGFDARGRNNRISFFTQDSWRIHPRLTLNPGVRLEWNRGKVPGTTVFKTNPIAPRIGFAWDFSGDGRSVLRGHYGRYYEALYASFYYYTAPGAFFPLTLKRIFNTSGFTETLSSTQGQQYAMDPNIKQPFLDQYMLAWEQQMSHDIVLSATWAHRKNVDLIETVSRDGRFVPVEGIIPGTGQQVTLFDYLNPSDDVLIYTNPAGLRRTYHAVILTASGRWSKNGFLQSSYVYSRSRGNIDNLGFDEAGIGGNTPFFDGHFLDTPNSLVNAQGRLTHDQVHQVKLQGTWFLPSMHMSISGNYTFHSGDTWTPRTDCLLTDDGNEILGDEIFDCHEFPQGPVLYFAEPRGGRRLEARNEIDLRVEWEYEIDERKQLNFMVDIFNLTNQRRATEVETAADEELGQPATLNFPRNIRLGVGFSW